MKPLQIVLCVVAGALGGAVILKLNQKAPAPAPVAQVQPQVQIPPATAPLTPAPPPDTPLVSATPADEAKPSPVAPPKPRREAAKPRYRQPVVENRSSTVNPPPVQAVPPPPPPEPAVHAEVSIPPARQEPENVTPPPPPPAPPEPHRVTLNAGTLLPVRLVDGLSSERNLPGDSFTATLDKELVVDGFVIAERGARVEGRVMASDKGGRVKGVSSLQVELVRLRTSDGQNVAIQTGGFERRTEESHRQDAEKIGGGAALGAIIGAIAGGGKGAAIGAGVGGAAGTGAVIGTRGSAANLPSETRVRFRIKAPVTITELTAKPSPERE